MFNQDYILKNPYFKTHCSSTEINYDVHTFFYLIIIQENSMII